MGSLRHPNSCCLNVLVIFAMTTYSLPQLFGPSNSSKNARTAAYATMPPDQDRYEVSLDLVTIAGTEYAMQANLAQHEDVAELEGHSLLCQQFLIWMFSAVSWSSTFTRSNLRSIPHRAPATAATINCSSSLHGRWTLHLAVPGR